MIDWGYVAGWVGVALGLGVPIPQLLLILETGEVGNISVGTYSLLVACMICYLLHAIRIRSKVFITAQSINIISNGVILIMLIMG